MLVLPNFSGSASPSDRYTPGTVTIYCADYWCPIILATTGMRRGECAYLEVDEIENVNGIHVFDI